VCILHTKHQPLRNPERIHTTMSNFLTVKLFKLRKFLGCAKLGGYVITSNANYAKGHGAEVVRTMHDIAWLRGAQHMFYVEHKVKRTTKPTIVRTNKHSFNRRGKYFVGMSADSKFLQVNDGKQIEYYSNSFHNVYRIVSRDGNDFITHEVSA
jgi:hypothetical protein